MADDVDDPPTGAIRDARRETFYQWWRRFLGPDCLRKQVFPPGSTADCDIRRDVARDVAGLNYDVVREEFPEGVTYTVRPLDHAVLPISPSTLSAYAAGRRTFGGFLSSYIRLLRSIADRLERENADLLKAANHDPAGRVPFRPGVYCRSCGRDLLNVRADRCPDCGAELDTPFE